MQATSHLLREDVELRASLGYTVIADEGLGLYHLGILYFDALKYIGIKTQIFGHFTMVSYILFHFFLFFLHFK